MLTSSLCHHLKQSCQWSTSRLADMDSVMQLAFLLVLDFFFNLLPQFGVSWLALCARHDFGFAAADIYV